MCIGIFFVNCLLEEFEEGGTVHLGGFFRDTHEVEYGRGDIGEESPYFVLLRGYELGRFFFVIFRRDEPEGDGVGRVFGVDFTGASLFQFLGIAVIGGDEKTATCLEYRGDEDGHRLVGRFHRFDGCFLVAGVGDHVGIGVIHEDEIVIAGHGDS